MYQIFNLLMTNKSKVVAHFKSILFNKSTNAESIKNYIQLIVINYKIHILCDSKLRVDYQCSNRVLFLVHTKNSYTAL